MAGGGGFEGDAPDDQGGFVGRIGGPNGLQKRGTKL
jgi:hypothetical protein